MSIGESLSSDQKAGETPSTWTCEQVEGVRVLTFQRLPLGMIRHRDVQELEALLEDAAAEGVGFVVLTGAGNVFIRHADLEDLAAMEAGQPTSGDPQSWIRVLRALDHGPFVTVAAINGQAWGGGFELALSCNLRVAAVSATFAFPEVALGILPGVAAHRAVAALPEGRAIELLISGRVLTAPEALSWGLVSACAQEGQSLNAALDLCRSMATYDHHSVLAARDLVLGFRDLEERDRRQLQSDRWDTLAARPIAQHLAIAANARYARGMDSEEALGLAGWSPTAWQSRSGKKEE